MKLLISLILAVSVQAGAHSDKKKSAEKKEAHHHHEHREHGAHQHGVGTVGVAFEALKGKVEFKIPAESIVGFEHEAKKDSDKKKQAEALAKFESKISEMLVFDTSLKCVYIKEKIEVLREENHDDHKDGEKNEKQLSGKAKKNKHQHHNHAAHSDFVALYNVNCEKSPAGTDLTVKIHSQFKKVKKLELQLIVDNLQKAQTITKDNTIVSLK